MLRIFTALLAAGAIATTVPAAAVATTPARPIVPDLPRPTGPYPVGTVERRLVDHSRPDPLMPGRPYRELMLSVFYPARHAARYPLAPMMDAGAAKHFAHGITAQDDGLPTAGVDWAGIRTYAHAGAPPDLRLGPRPVVLYSPGLGDDRTFDTTEAQDLASRGYVVVTVDHTYEASEVEFPGGRVVDSLLPKLAAGTKNPVPLLRKLLAARVADTRFVVGQLSTLDCGGRLDLGHVGMFGHSAGGFTAAQAMYEDRRIRAGLDLDGTLAFSEDDGDGSNPSPVARHGLDRPFLLFGSRTNDHYTQASWSQFWAHQRGFRRDLLLRGSEHASFTDAEAIVPQLPMSRSAIGFAPPTPTIAATRAYVAAFFDRTLRGRPGHLLDGASPRYPGVVFVP